jgi:hypothetical protein
MKSNYIINFFVFTVGIVSILFSASHLQAGELLADIDNDTRLESVQWKKFETTDMGDYYRLYVFDDSGDLLWKSPQKTQDNHPYIFSSTHTGISLPELLADIDKDGYVELLAQEPQSDVRAIFYRKLRWAGRTFEILPSQALMMRNPDSNHFSWVSREHEHGIWVSKFRRVAQSDLVKADVTYYGRDGVWSGGVALLMFTPNGAVVHRWIKPLFGGQTDEENKEAVVKNEVIGIVYGLDPNGDGFLSMRIKPQATEIGRLYNGDRVEILEQSGKWYKIKDIKFGRVGWSHSNWIRIE